MLPLWWLCFLSLDNIHTPMTHPQLWWCSKNSSSMLVVFSMFSETWRWSSFCSTDRILEINFVATLCMLKSSRKIAFSDRKAQLKRSLKVSCFKIGIQIYDFKIHAPMILSWSYFKIPAEYNDNAEHYSKRNLPKVFSTVERIIN